MAQGRIVKLDRGFPLAHVEGIGDVRCKHAVALVKGVEMRAAIGDLVELDMPDGHDMAIIANILPRRNVLLRKDPTERSEAQVLAANFDTVIVAQPLSELNRRRLYRELVLAFETGAKVVLVLTKSDLAHADDVERVRAEVAECVGEQVVVMALSEKDGEGIEALRALIPVGETAILMGRSGVGKSSLVNLLTGKNAAKTAATREYDGKGRHTTVSREIIAVPGGGTIVDMPGVRGLGMWEADEGIGMAFEEIEQLAAQCRFRDCRHGEEPGCAVRAAVSAGTLSAERLRAYRALKDEIAETRSKKEQAHWRENRGTGVRSR